MRDQQHRLAKFRYCLPNLLLQAEAEVVIQCGKWLVIVLFAEIENIWPLQMAVQSIRHNADDLAAGIQAAGLGGLIGSLISFDMTGIDFALTALFVTILLDQMKGASSRLPAAFAVVSSVVCLLVFGPDNFILPSLILTVAALTVFRRTIAPEKECV